MRPIVIDILLWLRDVQKGGFVTTETSLPSSSMETLYDSDVRKYGKEHADAMMELHKKYQTADVYDKPMAIWGRADIAGLSATGVIRIIEIKTAVSDLKQELASEKWRKYQGVADMFYYLLGPAIDRDLIGTFNFPPHAGILLYGHGRGIAVHRKPRRMKRELDEKTIKEAKEHIISRCYYVWLNSLFKEQRLQRCGNCKSWPECHQKDDSLRPGDTCSEFERKVDAIKL